MLYRSSSRLVSSLVTLGTLHLAACASGGGGSGDSGPPRVDGRIDDIDATTVTFPDAANPPVDQDAFALPDAGSDVGPLCVDEDGDGFLVGPASCGEMIDCDDADDSVNPGAVESCNLVDDDCNGSVDDAIAEQACGVGACEATVPGCLRGMVPTCEPGGPSREECNATDDDCDGMTDEGFEAPIVCGVGACQRMVPRCGGGAMMMCTPGMPSAETCNGIDDDCDGMIDDGLPSATCGVGGCMRTVPTCVGGMPQACAPLPPGTETCNGADDDCDGAIDDGFGTITCGMGSCQRTVLECVGGTRAMCMPGASGTETCNNLDDNCNGTIDDGLGSTSCGLGACARTVMNCIAGVPQTCAPGAPAGESCNGVDDDCNGAVDDLGTASCGVGLCARTVSSCIGGVPQTCVPGTGSPEVCGNGLDENCNGTPDDGCVTAPANDTCAGAILLTGTSGTRTADTITGAAGEVTDCAFGSDIWYRISLGARSILYIDTFGSSFDTSLSIRSGCTSAPVACEDDDCSTLQDVAVADLPAGTHYVVVHTRGSTTGTVNLRWQTLATGNGSATRVTTNGSFPSSTAGTGITTSGCTTGSGPGNLHYFTLCPSTSRTVTAATCSAASFDTVVYVRSAGGSEVACNDDGCSSNRSTVTTTQSGPGLYGIFVDGWLGASGTYTLAVSGL